MHCIGEKTISSYFYQLHGFVVQSDIPIPELLPASTIDEVTLTIREESTPQPDINDSSIVRLNANVIVSPSQFWMTIPGLASCWAGNGNEIIYQPMSGFDTARIKLFLLGSMLGAILMQRGLLVLHGSAVRIGNGIVICIGPSGVGKSTLTAAFLHHGMQVVSDDVCVINENGLIVPGIPRIKLFKEVAEQFGINTDGLPQIPIPNREKYSYPLGEKFSDKSLPIKAVYELNIADDGGLYSTTPNAIECCEILKNNLYRPSLVKGMEMQGNYFKQAINLAKSVKIVRLYRPSGGILPSEMVEWICSDIERRSR